LAPHQSPRPHSRWRLAAELRTNELIDESLLPEGAPHGGPAHRGSAGAGPPADEETRWKLRAAPSTHRRIYLLAEGRGPATRNGASVRHSEPQTLKPCPAPVGRPCRLGPGDPANLVDNEVGADEARHGHHGLPPGSGRRGVITISATTEPGIPRKQRPGARRVFERIRFASTPTRTRSVRGGFGPRLAIVEPDQCGLYDGHTFAVGDAASGGAGLLTLTLVTAQQGLGRHRF